MGQFSIGKVGIGQVVLGQIVLTPLKTFGSSCNYFFFEILFDFENNGLATTIA